MNLDTYLKNMEPVYDEADQYKMAIELQFEAYENEQDELKATAAWLESLEPTDEQINEAYEASLRGGD